MWHCQPFWLLKNPNFENPRGRRPPSWKKRKNRHISAMVWLIAMQFGTVTHVDPLESWPFWPLKIWNFENWKSSMVECRNVYGGCIKYLLRNFFVIEFGQFDSEILYNDTAKVWNCTHNAQNCAYRLLANFQIKQILTGEDVPLKLNLLIKQQILTLSTRKTGISVQAYKQILKTDRFNHIFIYSGQPIYRFGFLIYYTQ